MRHKEECLEKTVKQGCIKGNRPRNPQGTGSMTSRRQEIVHWVIGSATGTTTQTESSAYTVTDGPFSVQPSAVMKDQEGRPF